MDISRPNRLVLLMQLTNLTQRLTQLKYRLAICNDPIECIKIIQIFTNLQRSKKQLKNLLLMMELS